MTTTPIRPTPGGLSTGEFLCSLHFPNVRWERWLLINIAVASHFPNSSFTNCEFVEDDGEIVMWKNRKGEALRKIAGVDEE